MKALFALLLVTHAHADDDYMKLDVAEVQSVVETVLHDGSTAALNVTKDGVQHFTSNPVEWAMLLAAKKSVDDTWKWVIRKPELEVVLGAPVPWNGNANLLHYPVTVRVTEHAFKPPVCLDYRLELQGEYIIYRSDDGQYKQRGLDLKSFTPSILDQAQCV